MKCFCEPDLSYIQLLLVYAFCESGLLRIQDVDIKLYQLR